MRPWERWRYPYTFGVPVAALTFVVGVVLVVAVAVEAGLVAFLVGAGIAGFIGLYHRWLGDQVTMWQRLDQVVARHDPAWRPRRPKLTRTDIGVVGEVHPVPALTDVELTKALSEVAQTYGYRLVSHEVVLPRGLGRRSVGRELLRFEMAR